MRPPAVGGPAADRPRQALGDRVRALRNGRGWTLDQAAAHTGLSRSSLSKIEKGQMSPTYDAMLKLARGFGRDITELVAAGPGPGATGRRSITRAGEGEPYASPTCRHRLLAADLSHKTLLPFHTVVTARALEDYPDWDRHDSDDFLYVLTGSLIVYTELYEPAELHAGDSIYMDGRMGHACVSTGETDAVALWISVP
ncbi:MAG: helix-turn-helix domain-containing protein [Alphaproteobacteria bacterium]|nr:helix-turn-helix domain-containing protein [Alphaproteobacteria bacterium]